MALERSFAGRDDEKRRRDSSRVRSAVRTPRGSWAQSGPVNREKVIPHLVPQKGGGAEFSPGGGGTSIYLLVTEREELQKKGKELLPPSLREKKKKSVLKELSKRAPLVVRSKNRGGGPAPFHEFAKAVCSKAA